jgi:hypothetical protein
LTTTRKGTQAALTTSPLQQSRVSPSEAKRQPIEDLPAHLAAFAHNVHDTSGLGGVREANKDVEPDLTAAKKRG